MKEPNSLKGYAEMLKKYCQATQCLDCIFLKGDGNSYDYCKIGYGNNGAVPRNWDIGKADNK